MVGISLLFAVSSPAEDIKFKVTKVSGTKAIVQFSGAPDSVKPGKIYSVTMEQDRKSNSEVGRDHLLSLQTSYNNLTKKQAGVSTNSSTTVLGFGMGWNMVNYEMMLVLGISTLKYESISTSSSFQEFSFDWNFAPNDLQNDSVPAFRAAISNTTGSGSISLRTLPGFVYKSFAFSPSWAVVPGVFYQIDSTTTSGVLAQTTGIILSVGISNYF